MRTIITGVAVFVALITVDTPVFAQNIGRCQAYWQERNAILKESRYCFKSPRAIHYFGNGGCVHHSIEDVTMPKAQLERLLEIRAMEKANNCVARLTSVQ